MLVLAAGADADVPFGGDPGRCNPAFSRLRSLTDGPAFGVSVCVAGSLLLESLGGVTVPSWVAVCVTAFRLPCEGEDVSLAATAVALRPGLFSMLVLRVGGDGVVAAD